MSTTESECPRRKPQGWDLERGNPYSITSFPTPDSVIGYQKVTPNPQRLIADQVGEDYIVLTQRPNYRS